MLVVKGLDEYCQGYEGTKGLMQASTISALLKNCLQVSRSFILISSSVGVPQCLSDFYFDLVIAEKQDDQNMFCVLSNKTSTIFPTFISYKQNFNKH